MGGFPIMLDEAASRKATSSLQTEVRTMAMTTRREFHGKLLGSVMAYGLIELLWSRDLLGEGVKPVIQQWMVELQDLSRDLKQRKVKDVEFQTKMEDLYRRVDLAELCRLVQLEKVMATTKLPENGAANVGFDLSQIEGMPKPLVFGKQIFCLKQGRSIVPHGHMNMCTGFIILHGEFTGKHYDRLETLADHYVIKPTIDRSFKRGELSTISDHKDNVHWFKCDSDTGFVFNVHVVGYDNTIKDVSGRLYLDPEGEKIAGGLIKANKMTSKQCHEKFG